MNQPPQRIGLLLQKELSTNTTNGNDVERLQIFGVFQALMALVTLLSLSHAVAAVVS